MSVFHQQQVIGSGRSKMSAPSKRETSRIAIKFGSVTSSSTKKPPRPAPSSALGKRSRPSRGLDDDSQSGSEDDSRTNGGFQRITAFGSNGAELERTGRDDDRARANREPLVIAKQPNRDWRSEARARQRGNRQSRHARPAADQNQKDTEPADQDKAIKWGLTIMKKMSPTQDDEGGEGSKTSAAGAASATEGETEKGTGDGDGDSDSKDTTEKEAVDALLGRTTDDRTKTRLVIEGTANQVSEDDVFHRDFHDAPDASTLEDYEAMPVEEFGAALLRGMGWDGKDRGPKVKEVKRRPNQLGLGAKELKGDEDLGAWNQKNGSRKPRPPRLHEYRREEDKRRERREERYRDSYKGERDRERDERRSGHSSNSHRHRSRHDY